MCVLLDPILSFSLSCHFDFQNLIFFWSSCALKVRFFIKVQARQIRYYYMSSHPSRSIHLPGRAAALVPVKRLLNGAGSQSRNVRHTLMHQRKKFQNHLKVFQSGEMLTQINVSVTSCHIMRFRLLYREYMYLYAHLSASPDLSWYLA